MKKIYRHFSIFVLFIAIVLVASGCGRKNEPVAENGRNNEIVENEKSPLPPLQKGEERGETATSTEDVDTADWKVYKNEEVGIILKYPSNINLLKYGESVDSSLSSKLFLHIGIGKIDSIPEFQPLHYDRETSIKSMEALEKGEFGPPVDFLILDSRKVIKIGNVYAKEFMVLRRIEICDVTFERKAIFYYNGYEITITLYGPGQSIISSMPQYFKIEKYCGGVHSWLKREAFYEDVSNKKGSKAANEWYDLFDKIISTINLD